jgi:hypothetical protein
MDADVQATFLESQQCLAVAERKYHTQVSAFLHSGQVQQRIDIQRGNRKLARALGGGLSRRLSWLPGTTPIGR